jgi:Bacterial aa3 type cytochrome c oxidase subunit IV
MAVDQELESHLATWRGFTRLVKWTVALAVIVVVLLALITL